MNMKRFGHEETVFSGSLREYDVLVLGAEIDKDVDIVDFG